MNERPDYDVGDVVECVDSKPRSHNSARNLADISKLKAGSPYRVASMHADSAGNVCVDLSGIRRTARFGFLSDRFRKVRAADEDFTAQIRALKPIRKHQSA